MMPDIFSSFDPYVSSCFMPNITTMLSMNLMVLISLVSLYFWASTTHKTMVMYKLITLMYNQLLRTFMIHLKGMTSMIIPLFIMVVIINLMGLIPYFFSLSSHLMMTLTLSLPLWLSMIMSSMMKSPKQSIAHLLPEGAPNWLNMFLVLIESTSIMVRPITLSFRLAANMSAGHIILSLMGTYAASSISNMNYSQMLTLYPTLSFYVLFEVAICLIQGYIFCLLLSLYSEDHAH